MKPISVFALTIFVLSTAVCDGMPKQNDSNQTPKAWHPYPNAFDQSASQRNNLLPNSRHQTTYIKINKNEFRSQIPGLTTLPEEEWAASQAACLEATKKKERKEKTWWFSKNNFQIKQSAGFKHCAKLIEHLCARLFKHCAKLIEYLCARLFKHCAKLIEYLCARLFKHCAKLIEHLCAGLFKHCAKLIEHLCAGLFKHCAKLIEHFKPNEFSAIAFLSHD
uniref:Saposin B-type domain-containing protein n=1 Tax=Globodera rostochiensis TaxID=31243 RepID=A0A914I322_GLORO